MPLLHRFIFQLDIFPLISHHWISRHSLSTCSETRKGKSIIRKAFPFIVLSSIWKSICGMENTFAVSCSFPSNFAVSSFSSLNIFCLQNPNRQGFPRWHKWKVLLENVFPDKKLRKSWNEERFWPGLTQRDFSAHPKEEMKDAVLRNYIRKLLRCDVLHWNKCYFAVKGERGESGEKIEGHISYDWYTRLRWYARGRRGTSDLRWQASLHIYQKLSPSAR